MITVPEAAEKIIKRSRYLLEAMSKGFINNSSLARYIKPEIEEMLIKKVNESSIIMALNRLQKTLEPKSKYSNIFKNPPTMMTRSNLAMLSIVNSQSLNEKYDKLFRTDNLQKHHLVLTIGTSESTLILSDEMLPHAKKVLAEEKIVSEITNLSSITIHLPKEATSTPGVFYFFLKSLAWEGINKTEIVSTKSEFTFLFEDKNINKAFSVLKSLFNADN